jgi:hypothetical protein
MPTTLTVEFEKTEVSYPSKTVDFSKLDHTGSPHDINDKIYAIKDAEKPDNTPFDTMKENDSVVDKPETQEAVADVLYDLELFKGTDIGYELSNPLSRAQAATIIVRLLGKADEVEKREYTSIFTDVSDDHWAKNYIMFCYENKITFGTSENTYAPSRMIPYEQFQTLVLRTLGYTANPEDAGEIAVEIGMMSENAVSKIAKGEFKRGDMVIVMEKALKTPQARGNRTLARDLAIDGTLDLKKATELGVLPNFSRDDTRAEIGKVVNDKF